MKNNKGITLIALVITIIVLLILAGVSIAMLTGNNGILTQAGNAKVANAKAEVVEKVNMELNAQLANAMAGKGFQGEEATDNLASLPTGYSVVVAPTTNSDTYSTSTEFTITVTAPSDATFTNKNGKVAYDNSTKSWVATEVK